MGTSTEETISALLTPDDREAAKILLELSQGTQRHKSREENEDATYDDEVFSKKITKNSKQITIPRIKLEVDDSDETLMIIQEWNQTKPNLGEKLFRDKVERYNQPIKKQLTVSNVKKDQSRLMFSKDQVKKKMLPLLKGSEILKGTNGLDVSVYGPNEVVRDMKFKIWNKNTPVLISGWKEFVTKYKLKEHCDFLTIWMFRHIETGKICFAINKTKHSTITRPLKTNHYTITSSLEDLESCHPGF